jgi:hypothetical protein
MVQMVGNAELLVVGQRITFVAGGGGDDIHV